MISQRIKPKNIIIDSIIVYPLIIIIMRSYFKSMAKSLYEKTVEDQYLEPVTQTEVYSIINRKRSSSIKLTHPNDYEDNQKQSKYLLQNLDRIALINPQRQFKLLGNQYTYQIINIRIKQLRFKFDEIKNYMLNNYDKSLACIQTALVNLEDAKNIEKTKNKSANLKIKINALQKTVEKTSKITKINIKLNNIKNLLKIAQGIPNIKKMTVFQLKNIDLQQVNELKSTICQRYGQKNGKLQCIQHLDDYIDKVGSQQLRIVIGQIGKCLLKFDNTKYEKVLKDFVVTKSKIKFQKLLLRLFQTQIRDKQNQVQQNSNVNELYLTCQRYLTVLINMSKIFRWHRQNLAVIDASPQIQESIRVRKESQISNCSETSDQKYPIINLDLEESIKINTKQMKLHICELMDQCLKQIISQKLFALNISHQQILENLYLINRFMQVGYCFSAYYFNQSKQEAIQILQRKCYKLQQKGIKQFNQTLSMEEGNQWNRLPILNNFRHRGIDKSLFKFKRVVNSQNFLKLKENGFRYLNISEQLIQSDKIQQVRNKEETYELKLFRLTSYQKIQKSYNIDLKQTKIQQHTDPQVVICQSSITILNYFDNFFNIYFHVPILSIRVNILDKMLFFVEYYIYYIFQTFLSQNFKNVFFQSFKTIQQKYLQKRIRALYKNLYRLISNFSLGCQSMDKIRQQNNGNNLQVNGNEQNRKRKKSIQTSRLKNRGFFWTKSQIRQTKIVPQNAIKSRVISSESIKFILNYFQHIINSLKKYDLNVIASFEQNNNRSKNQINQLDFCVNKINELRKIQVELSDLLLTDIVPKNMNISFVDQILKKIRWHQQQNWSQINDYGQLILKNIKGTHQKIKGISKGEIPYYIGDVIFCIYWKSQLTYMVREFLSDHIESKQKGNTISKLSFQKLIDLLYEGLIEYLKQKYKNSQKSNQNNFQSRLVMINTSYEKIKSIFPIILQTDWQQCKKKLQKSLMSHEFIYKISINLMKASQSCARLSSGQVQQRRLELNQFIENKVLLEQ